ncbi:lysosomal-trafficking regulator isoform X2 [Bombina bombina]|uniref:lysosomal-trafficking regulator isoform X2 n=1 Tax=Bombina bombina TaxID=8345 RepID=UPI00235AA654|nr:lysosomal-trafficking regulator isoform X2 [Bombina bombina]
MNSSCNSLAREFLTDVNTLCNAGAQGAESRDEEEEESHMAELGEYLIKGRGFMLLSTLNTIVDQDLTCREELLTLLLSLLPLVWKIPVNEEKAREFNLPLLTDLFATKETNTSLQKSQERFSAEGVSNAEFVQAIKRSLPLRKTKRQCKTTHRHSAKDARKSQLSSSDSEANMDDKCLVTVKQRRSQLAQPLVSSHSKDLGQASRISLQHEVESKMNSDTTLCDTGYEVLNDPAALRIVNNMENSPFDLCYVLLSLLEKVCKFDIMLNHNSSLAACGIPSLTEFLSGFGDCCSPNKECISPGWTEEPVALVQRMLLRTVLHLLSVDVSSTEVMPDNLRKNLIDLLRTSLKIKSYLEKKMDPFEPRPKKTLKEIQEDFIFSKFRHRALLLPELLEGILQIMLSCIQSASPNPFYFSQSIELLHEFIQHNGFELFEKTVIQMEWISTRDESLSSQASDHVWVLINSIIKIISVIKKVKSEQLHHSMCTRKRHRRCEYSHFMHHHRDLSGFPVSIFKGQVLQNPFEANDDEEVHYPERSCCIAVCAHQCLRLLQHVSLSSTYVQILSGICNVGICCCMDPKSVVKPLLYVLKLPALKSFQQHIMSILTNLVLDQLGGGEVSPNVKQASCNICIMDCDQLAELQDTIQGRALDSATSLSSCSPSYRFQGILPCGGSEHMLWKWDALQAYQDIVFGTDQQLSLQIASHICHLIQRGNAVVQWKLYTLIFNGILQRGVEMAHHSQHLGVTTSCNQACSYHSKCLPQDVLKIYLQALPELLKYRVIREIFLSSNGLNQLTELNYLDSVRCLCLKVFETLIVCLDEQHTDYLTAESDNNINDQSELSSDCSVLHQTRQPCSEASQSLRKFYAELKDASPKKKKDVNQNINTINLFLCLAFLCVSKEAESDLESTNESEDTSGYDSTASEPLSNILPKLPIESLVLPSVEQTHRAADIWTMCYRLYLSSQVFQKQFHKLGGFELCHRLVIMIIQKLSKSKEDIKKKNLSTLNPDKLNITVPETSYMEPCDKREPFHDGNVVIPEMLIPGKHLQTDDQVVSTEFSPTKRRNLTAAALPDLEKEWSVQIVRLFEALLAICLHSASTSQQKVETETSSQNLSVEHIILGIQDHFSKSQIIQTNLAQPIFDCLLRIAVANSSFSSETFEEQKDMVRKTDEECPLHSGQLSEEPGEVYSCSFKLFAEEEGYEADSESNPEDISEDEEIKTEAGEFVNSSDQVEMSRNGDLLYPEICTLELNLLSSEHNNLSLVTHVFHSFLEIMKAKEKNAMLLIQQGTIKTLLLGFQNIMASNDPDLQECHEVLITLLVTLMSYRTCSDELALFLRYFLENKFPVDLLLKGLLNIVEMNNNMIPLQYLTFPLLHSPVVGNIVSQKSSSIASAKMTGFLRRTKILQNKDACADSLINHLLSSWHIAPIHLPLVGQNCWPHMSEGFSFSLWFKLELNSEAENLMEKGKKMKKRSKSFSVRVENTDGDKNVGNDFSVNDKLVDGGCLHVLSLGSKALMLQIWANPNTEHFIFRVCVDPNDEVKSGVLAQAETQENIFTLGNWHHLALTYKEQSENKKNACGKIHIWVSGQSKQEVTMEYTHPRKASLSSESNKTFCMLGHCTATQEESLHLAGKLSFGNLLLFNGAKIGTEEAFELFCRGPDFTSLMPCKYGKIVTDHSKYLSKDILQSAQIQNLIMTNKDVDMGPLIENLAVVYDTCSPAQYTIYEPVIRIKGSTKTAPSQRPFSTKDVISNTLDTQALKMLQPSFLKNTQSILHEIGGIGTFVFLFARIVEISSCEETQSLGLQIILTLTKHNQQRIQERENCDVYSMIHQVLIRPKCIVGFHVLKTLLEGCTGDQMLNLCDNGQFNLNVESTSVIKDVRLLEHLLLEWKIWSKAETGVWETLLAALEVLIRANHPHQMFNIKQLLKARVVHHFLLACQVLQEHREGNLKSIPHEVCRSYIKIIEEVLGSPPDLELLKLLFHFLLAVHPPTNTYVCHNPSNFFFSLHIDGKIFQEKVKSIVYQRNYSSGGRSSASPGLTNRTPVYPDNLHKDIDESEFSSQHGYLSVVRKSRSRSLPASPSISPKVPPKRLGGSTVDLKDDSENFHPNQDTARSVPSLIKREDQYVSSCESATTICESEALSIDITVVDSMKDDLELPGLHIENQEDDADKKFSYQSSGDQLLLQRPDSLKGIYSFKRGQSVTSLGLAFASSGPSATPPWTIISDKKGSDEWDNFPFTPLLDQTHSNNMDERSVEDCITLICCGLYDLLRGVLLTMPDLMLGDVLDALIQPEILIVLVNHPSPLIQQGVVKLLDAYFHRASKEQKERFLKKHGFPLLANQLYLHQGTQGLIECFLEMFFGRPVGLDEEFDVEDIKHSSVFRKWCIIPLLGLLENSLYDVTLLHNSFCLLLQILNSCSKVADMLLDNGLLYALCNTLAALGGIETSLPMDEYTLLVCDIQQLLVAVTIHSCSSSGSQYFRIVEDLIILLGYLHESKNERMQNMAVNLQFKVLQSAIEFIKTTANQDSQGLASSFHFTHTPHHAIYQKRKSIAGSHRLSLAQSDPLLMKMRSVASNELTVMMQRRMSQENPIRASESEFVQRLQRLTVLAVNRLIYQDINEDCLVDLSASDTSEKRMFSGSQFESSEEEMQSDLSNIKIKFQNELFKTMIEGIKLSLGGGRSSSPKQQWKTILWSCKDTFRVQLGRLIVHLLSPSQPIEGRKQALEMVNESKNQDILRECLSPGLQHGPKLVLYLYELMHDHKEELTKEEQATAAAFLSALKLSGYKCIPPNAPPKPDLIKAIKEEQKKYENEENTNKAAWRKTISNNQQNLFQRLEAKSKDISKIAGDITQSVSLSQGMERKKVMQHIRSMYKVDLSASRHWQELVQQLTHDRAVWYDPESYPTSWQLDPTEGPNRERRRLQRCYLTIPNKYILKDRRKPEETIKPPLSYLFEDKTHSSFSSTVKDKAASELIRVNRRCINVAPSRETFGELLLGKTGMYFVEDNASDTVESSTIHGETEPASFSWTYEEIKEVHKRWWQLRDNAVEIFLTNGRTLLLAFDNTKVRDDVYHNILSNNLPNLLEYGNITALTHLWCTGQITNFEYLTHLNKHAGRSFNDLMQYPVFPFIVSDYVSETLDLHETIIYRNLAKPIAVQSKEKEDRYVDNYKYLEDEYGKGDREDDPMPPVQPYHYGSHYSNSGTVLHFLVRMPPFTKMFLAYQDQSFDIPDRTFHSMNTTWRLSSYESMTDVKELIPEFFYLPEFLVNREGFDFGVRQNGERVNHVNLPPWARNDPRLFILIHRQALESDYVSQTICHWIDLVFGCKQKGRSAVQAINVFHPATYFGMDVSAVEDPVQRRALETMIKTYGQTPRQLFHSAHVSRPASRLLMEGELPVAMGILVQLAFRETRDLTKENVYPSPLPWIKGLKWGEYVGSPSAPDPSVCFSQPHGEKFGSLQALPTRAICGLSWKFCLMMIYSKEQGVRSMHSTDIQWSAILSWGYADNILRLKSKQSEPPVNFIQCSALHQVTSCAWVPDSCQLFTGSKCGVITAYLNRFTNSTPLEIEVESQAHLYGHTAEITSLFVCKPYSILISVSKDGTCILWDLNRLCYVQSLAGHKSPVTAVSASETTGDIATVCDSVGGGSDLRLWTVNGDLIGHVHCREIICSVAFSNQPEGISVNVIAGGLENGVVRLWSTWDLKPVREITFPKSNKPIVSLTFSCDGHHLYTANSDGTVIAWCRKDQQRLKLPMFYSFLSNYAAG